MLTWHTCRFSYQSRNRNSERRGDLPKSQMHSMDFWKRFIFRSQAPHVCSWPHALLRQFSPRWLLLAWVIRAYRVLASLLLVQGAGESSRRLPCSKASEAGKAVGMLSHQQKLVPHSLVKQLPVRESGRFPHSAWTQVGNHTSVCESVTCHFTIFINVTLLFGDPSAQTGSLLVHYSHFFKDSSTLQCKVVIDIKGHFSAKLLSLHCPQR